MPGDRPFGIFTEVVPVWLFPGPSTGTNLLPITVAPALRVEVAEKKNVVVDALAPPDPILLAVSVILTVPPARAAPPEATNDETVKSGVGVWSAIGTAEGTDTFPQASAN